ncbi:MAG: hypothetical protein AAGI68_03100 [Planctomycetota bacterium]
MGQQSGIELRVDRASDLGLAGVVRPGGWTGMRVRVSNPSAVAQEVVLRWELRDEDGDRVLSERRVTVVPSSVQTEQSVWLYAAWPFEEDREAVWTVQALAVVEEADSGGAGAAQNPSASAGLAEVAGGVGGVLGEVSVVPLERNVAEPGTALVGVLGSAGVGLDRFEGHTTRHEDLRIVRGMTLGDLPDRWYGMSGLEAIVWLGQDGGTPAGTGMSAGTRGALREWVYRGGHLVVVLPLAGQPWSASALGDLMPFETGGTRAVRGAVPLWVGRPVSGTEPVSMLGLTGLRDGASVLERGPKVVETDALGAPLLVARRYGFGRVTVMGLDVASKDVQAKLSPRDMHPLWKRVFAWKGPVLLPAEVERQRRLAPPQQLRVASMLSKNELGERWLNGRLAMTGTAAPALLLAIVVFGLYWLVAGPVAFWVLRSRKYEAWNWLVFVVVVAGFGALTWGGAALLRPGDQRIAHMTVLDLDGNGGPARARSWASVFVPRFGEAAVRVGNPEGASVLGFEAHDTLASPGSGLDGIIRPYPDIRSYRVDAASPEAAAVPVRATSKRLRVDYLGPTVAGWTVTADGVGLNAQGRLVGRVTQDLPGVLTNVRVVVCSGEGGEPMFVSLPRAWRPGEAIELAGLGSGGDRGVARRLAVDVVDMQTRNPANEGFLGEEVGRRQVGGIQPDTAELAGSAKTPLVAQDMNVASFYDALPHPHIRAQAMRGASVIQRSLLRGIDLTTLTKERRLIVIGYLEASPLPVPMTLDGQPLGGDATEASLTVVRWIYDF